ncbi:hypothetical protein ACWDYJ_23520 [Streptomyces sp. NPDC003042]
MALQRCSALPPPIVGADHELIGCHHPGNPSSRCAESHGQAGAHDPVVGAGFVLSPGAGFRAARGGVPGHDLREQWQCWVEGAFSVARQEGRLSEVGTGR